jgi:hypothetical protein
MLRWIGAGEGVLITGREAEISGADGRRENSGVERIAPSTLER